MTLQRGVALPWTILTVRGTRRVTSVLGFLLICAFPLSAFASGKADEIVPGVTALLICAGMLQLFVRTRASLAEDRVWLAELCRAALLGRALLATALYCGPWDAHILAPDQAGYDYLPTLILHSWEGEAGIPVSSLVPQFADRQGYFFLVAIQYFVLGPSFIVPRFVNCLAGATLVYYAFSLATQAFGRSAGRVAAVWVAFFPSLMLWSALNMRDIWLALSVAAILWHALLLRERFRGASLATIVVHLIWIQFTRPYLVVIMLAAVTAVFGLARAKHLVRDIAVGVLILGTLFGLRQTLGLGDEGLAWLELARISAYRDTMAGPTVGASGYLRGVDLTDSGTLVTFVPLAVVYFLFAPFPWQMFVARRLITAPEMLLWYWSMPYVLRSTRAVLGDRSGNRLALLLATGIITIAFAVGTANVGLAYRYRAQLISLYLAFAAAGYVEKRAGQVGG